MKKRLITSRALTPRRDQCRVLRDGLSASPFRGAIGSEFHEWIRGHWGLAGSLLRPVQKLFRKLPSLPDFFPAARRDAADVFNYTLLTQVQMNLVLGVSNRMLFENSTYSSGITSAAKVREQPGSGLATASTSREFWLSLSHLLFQTQPRAQERHARSYLSFLTGARLPPATGSATGADQVQSGSWEVIGSSFTKLLYTSRRWLQSLTLATVRGASGPRGSDASPENRLLTLVPSASASNLIEEDSMLAWPALTLRKILHAAFKAGDQLSQHWSLPSLLISRPAVRMSSSGGAFAGLPPLTLVVSQRSSREVNTNTETRFAESSTMYFAKHASQLVEKLSSVLKEARQTQPEIRTVAPPQIEIDRLTRQVHQQLERELRIEKERRGL